MHALCLYQDAFLDTSKIFVCQRLRLALLCGVERYWLGNQNRVREHDKLNLVYEQRKKVKVLLSEVKSVSYI